MARFRLLRRARADLLDIGAFTADRWGDDQAERYLIALFVGFHTLVDRPELRRPFCEIPPYFRALVGKHAVFYRVTRTATSTATPSPKSTTPPPPSSASPAPTSPPPPAASS